MISASYRPSHRSHRLPAVARTFLLVSLSFLATATARAQQETLFDLDIEQSWFGGPTARFAHLAHDWGLMVGVRGEWVMDHVLGLGVAGYGLATRSISATFSVDGKRPTLEMGYGGFIIEYIINPNGLVHFSLESLIGAGGLTYSINGGDHDPVPRADNFGADAFFVAEPGITVDLNVTKFLHLSVGAGYRIISKVDFHDLESKDVSGMSIGAMVKFGTF